jgi:hypothetical protein
VVDHRCRAARQVAVCQVTDCAHVVRKRPNDGARRGQL